MLCAIAHDIDSSPLVPVLTCLAVLLSLLPVAPDHTRTNADDSLAAVRSIVLAYARPFDPDWETTPFRVEWADLNADGLQDALVYLDGGAWCGSGGCTVLVLEAMPEEDAAEIGAYAPAAEISLMHGPITIATTRSNGWSDLIVETEDGEIRRLAFDGETYPFSPAEGEAMASKVQAETILFAAGQ